VLKKPVSNRNVRNVNAVIHTVLTVSGFAFSILQTNRIINELRNIGVFTKKLYK
jgi:hypothetical protein